MIRSGPSRVDDCSTLISGRSVASLRCPSPAKSGHAAKSPIAVVRWRFGPKADARQATSPVSDPFNTKSQMLQRALRCRNCLL